MIVAAEPSLIVSRETRERLNVYLAELRRWQAIKNLVGPKTLDDAWNRHIVDSLQLASLASGRIWADLGSGAGLPGIVLAIADPDLHIHLVESDQRRCAFLGHVSRLLDLSVTIWSERIETAVLKLVPVPHVVTARALARLSDLLAYSENMLKAGSIGLFLKGLDHVAELTEARRCWTFDADIIPSRTSTEGGIIRVHRFEGRHAAEANSSDQSRQMIGEMP